MAERSTGRTEDTFAEYVYCNVRVPRISFKNSTDEQVSHSTYNFDGGTVLERSQTTGVDGLALAKKIWEVLSLCLPLLCL